MLNVNFNVIPTGERLSRNAAGLGGSTADLRHVVVELAVFHVLILHASRIRHRRKVSLGNAMRATKMQ